jgi:hypothetical protein
MEEATNKVIHNANVWSYVFLPPPNQAYVVPNAVAKPAASLLFFETRKPAASLQSTLVPWHHPMKNKEVTEHTLHDCHSCMLNFLRRGYYLRKNLALWLDFSNRNVHVALCTFSRLHASFFL